jgi:hypothetical protein
MNARDGVPDANAASAARTINNMPPLFPLRSVRATHRRKRSPPCGREASSCCRCVSLTVTSLAYSHQRRARLARVVLIRDATEDDWRQIWPFLRQIARAGETYTYDPDMDEPTARGLWLSGPPTRTAVAVHDDGTVLGAARWAPTGQARGRTSPARVS